jgi:hypothetical protein
MEQPRVKRWHIINPNLYQDVEQSINKAYPSLHIYIEDEIVYIRGNLVLRALDNREIDHYAIEIQLPDNYPVGVPIVKEVGGRIPKNSDRHFSKVGTTEEAACLFLPDERFKYWPLGATIIKFIEGPVKSFFLWQTDYDLNNGKSTFGQRGHGINGIIEFYSEEIGTNDKGVIIRFLEYLVKNEVKGHWLCYCGSGEKMRNCHFDKLKELRAKILTDDALKSLAFLRK